MNSFNRGNKFATVTNTTVEIAVSEHVFGSVYGEDGGNVDRMRQVRLQRYDGFLFSVKLWFSCSAVF